MRVRCGYDDVACELDVSHAVSTNVGKYIAKLRTGNPAIILLASYVKGALMLKSFAPKDMALLMEVVGQACVEIGGCDEPTKAVIATRVLKSAGRGGRDFDALLSIALYGSPVKAEWHAG